MFIKLTLLLSLLVAVASAKTLVLVDSITSTQHFTKFLATLQGRGHELVYETLTPTHHVELKQFGEPLYDSLVWLAPHVKLANNNPSLSNILQFIDEGHSVVVAGGAGYSEAFREFAQECGLKLDPSKSSVVDHFSNLDQDPTMVLSSETTKFLFPGSSSSPILFKGVGHKIVDEDMLALSILSGAPTSYVGADDPKTKVPARFGKDIKLVTGLQFRNNARVLFSGSVEIFTDEFLAMNEANAQFVEVAAKWGLAESHILRASSVQHHRLDGSQPETQLKHKARANLPLSTFPQPEIAPNSLVYRIKDEVVFSLVIEELVDGAWVPFKQDDVQMEFVMLDPYLRKTMKHDDKGKFSLEFMIPDVYGVYKFRVMYRRPGYASLSVEEQVSIRPFRHNEYERFISSAYPYYTSAFTMMASFFVFSVMFLGTRD